MLSKKLAILTVARFGGQPEGSSWTSNWQGALYMQHQMIAAIVTSGICRTSRHSRRSRPPRRRWQWTQMTTTWWPWGWTTPRLRCTTCGRTRWSGRPRRRTRPPSQVGNTRTVSSSTFLQPILQQSPQTLQATEAHASVTMNTCRKTWSDAIILKRTVHEVLDLCSTTLQGWCSSTAAGDW